MGMLRSQPFQCGASPWDRDPTQSTTQNPGSQVIGPCSFQLP